ncbi:hypothetical protein BC828DRAFT_374361 [Blastocladiella britannica]|nr:hypothetical protein BC828DRAFT_374361 [Blastocladiella britannica]
MAHALFSASLAAAVIPPRTASAIAATTSAVIGPPPGIGPPSTDSANHVLAWDTARVASWVISAGFQGYDRRFLENDISGDVLVRLNDEFLRELGIDKVGTRLAILKAIHSLKRMHGVPLEPGDFIPLVAEPSSEVGRSGGTPAMAGGTERKRTLFGLWDHGSTEAADNKKLVDLLRQQGDQIARLTNDLAFVMTELQHVREHLGAARMTSMGSFGSGTLAAGATGAAQGNATPRASRKSPTLLARSLGTPAAVPHSVSTPSLPSALGSAPWSPPPASSGLPGDEEDSTTGTIKVFGDRLPSRLHDGYKSFRVSLNDTCSAFLPIVLKKHKIADDWHQYALFVVPSNAPERCLGYDEKMLRVFNEYFVTAPASPEPYFVLRHIKQAGLHLQLVSRDPTDGRQSAESPTVAYATAASAARSRAPSASGPSSSTSPNGQAGATAAVPPLPPAVPTNAAVPPSPTTVSSAAVAKAFSSLLDDPTGTGAAGSAQTPPPPPLSPSAAPGAGAGPSHSLTSPSTGVNPLPSPTEASRAVAVYEYAAARPDELSLIIGDAVVVRSRSTGWCVVDKGTETGWVPAGCLVEENMGEDRLEGTTGRVLYDYAKIGPNELSIRKGETLRLIKGYQHWLLAESNDGGRGWVPSCYVTLSSKGKAAADRSAAAAVAAAAAAAASAGGGVAPPTDLPKRPRPPSPAPDLIRGMSMASIGSAMDDRAARRKSGVMPMTIDTHGFGVSGPQSAPPVPMVPPLTGAAATTSATAPSSSGAAATSGGSSDRRLDAAIQSLMDILIRSRAADAASAGMPSPHPPDADTSARSQFLGASINFLQSLTQLPAASPRYAMAVDCVERLATRGRALDPATLAEEVHASLADLVASVRLSSTSTVTGTTSSGGVSSPARSRPPPNALSGGPAVASSSSSSTPPPQRVASATPPPVPPPLGAIPPLPKQ